MIGRKQQTSETDWHVAIAGIESTVYRSAVEARMAATVRSVRETCAGKRVAYGWSGGKDSVLLGEVMRRAGFAQCCMVICNLEFPEFLRWATDHMPGSLEIVNTGQDLRWLAAHEEWLFPTTAAAAAKWFAAVQHRGQTTYFHKHRLDVLVTGRRRADGNNIRTAVDTNGQGVTRFHPLADWSHEELLAAMHYFGLPFAPCYAWPHGFRQGTGPWPARQWCGGVRGGWREVFAIDADVVHEAATLIPSAREFLRSVGAC